MNGIAAPLEIKLRESISYCSCKLANHSIPLSESEGGFFRIDKVTINVRFQKGSWSEVPTIPSESVNYHEDDLVKRRLRMDTKAQSFILC